MKFSNVVLTSIFSAMVLAAPAAVDKRAQQVVTVVTTQDVVDVRSAFFADLLGTPTTTAAAPAVATTAAPQYVAPVAATPVAAAPVAASAVQPVAHAPVAAAVSAPAAAPVAAAPAAATTTASDDDSDSDSSLLSDAKSLLSFLFGSKPKSSSAAAVTPAATVATAAAAVAPAASKSAAKLFSASSSTNVPAASGLVAAPAPPSLPSTFKTVSYSSSFSIPSASSGSSVPVPSGAAPGAAAAIGAKGITYSPYTKTNACKTTAEVAQDVARLTDFDIIRLYSTDCSGIENLLASITSSQQLFLGIWNIDSASVQSGLSTIQSAVEGSSRGWSAVNTIAIGNEQVNSGTATPAQIGTAIQVAKSWLSSNASAYTGPVVSVDTLVAVVANPQLCGYSDYLAVNAHPYWDGNVAPSNSGPWLENQIQNLQNACGSSKSVLITETGWPTKGKPFGNCVPSIPNQVAALTSLVSSLGDQILAFTMYNDYWKDPGPYDVEQDWGIFGDPYV